MSPISDEPTKKQKSDICRIIRVATNTAFRRREQHKALSDSPAFENAPVQRLLNGQIVAPRRGANSHCNGSHCWIQRMLARIRHLLAGVRRRGVYDVQRYSYRYTAIKVCCERSGSPPGHHNMNPNDSK